MSVSKKPDTTLRLAGCEVTGHSQFIELLCSPQAWLWVTVDMGNGSGGQIGISYGGQEEDEFNLPEQS